MEEHELGGYYSQFSEEDSEMLDMQRRVAESKTVEPSSLKDFLLLVTQDIREKKTTQQRLANRHQQIYSNFNVSIVGLDRLQSLVKSNSNLDLMRARSDLNDIIKKHKGTGYTIERCKRILDEVAINAQLVADTINDKLADRHKKVAVQKELGLRLKDIDDTYQKCEAEMDQESKDQELLARRIQELLAVSGVKLPEVEKDRINTEDKLAAIILDRQKAYQQPKKALGDAPGEIATPAIAAPKPIKDKTFYIVAGLAIGSLVCAFLSR